MLNSFIWVAINTRCVKFSGKLLIVESISAWGYENGFRI